MPMSIDDAIERVRTLAQSYEAVQVLAAAAEQLKLAQQQASETAALAERNRQEAYAAAAQRDGALAEIDAARKQAQQLVDDAKGHADQALSDAHAQADSIIAAGRLGAANLKAEADEARDAVAADLAAATAKRDALLVECTQLEDRIAQAKAAAAQLLGQA